jgi:hypothetical protein
MSVEGKAFWAVALVVSALRGVYSENIFGGQPKDAASWSIRHVWSTPSHAHQAWFNFVGSLAGWAALWTLAPPKWLTSTPTVVVSWGSAALAVAAFAGITGHLPFLFMKGVEGVATLVLWAKETASRLVGDSGARR